MIEPTNVPSPIHKITHPYGCCQCVAQDLGQERELERKGNDAGWERCRKESTAAALAAYLLLSVSTLCAHEGYCYLSH